MQHQNKKPDPAKVSGSKSNSTPGNYHTPTSIRRRFGTGWPGYEAAKFAWSAANPSAAPSEYSTAMRFIARALRV